MKKVLLSLAAAGMLGFGFAAAPATALPVAPVQQIDGAAGNLVEVQMTRRERMMMKRKRMTRSNMMRSRSMRRGRMMRSRGMMRRGSMMRSGGMMNRGGMSMSTRRVMRGGDPNSESPSRAPGAQRTGQTSGGSRY